MIFERNEYLRRVSEYNQEVTVFMLTHNREYYLKLAIDSLLGQTYQNYTAIILDNCSVDHTKDVVEAIDDDRVMYLYRESKIDDSNMEFALRICATKYFIILHDDDIVEKTYLETVVKKMNNSDYVAISVSATFIDADGNCLTKETSRGEDVVFCSEKQFFRFILSESAGMIFPSVIWRTDFYKNLGLFSAFKKAGPAGDQLVFFETERKGGKMCLLGERLIRYRLHHNQDSHFNYGTMDIQLYSYLLQDPYYSQAIDEIFSFFMGRMRHMNKAILGRYLQGTLSAKDYHDIFKSLAMLYLKKRAKGWIAYDLMKLMYYLRKPIYCLRQIKALTRTRFPWLVKIYHFVRYGNINI